MVKLLNLILLCFITVAACSPVSSNDEGDFGESLERREIEEAYQILQSKLYGRIERSCIVCVGKAVAIDDKEVNRQFIESIFDLEGRAYVKYYDKNLVSDFEPSKQQQNIYQLCIKKQYLSS